MIKCVIGHSGYHSCDKYSQSRDNKEGIIVFPVLDAILHTDNFERAQINDEYHLSDSYLLLLQIDMLNDFSIDYIHCVSRYCEMSIKYLAWKRFNHRIYRICIF